MFTCFKHCLRLNSPRNRLWGRSYVQQYYWKFSFYELLWAPEGNRAGQQENLSTAAATEVSANAMASLEAGWSLEDELRKEDQKYWITFSLVLTIKKGHNFVQCSSLEVRASSMEGLICEPPPTICKNECLSPKVDACVVTYSKHLMCLNLMLMAIL